MSASIKMLALMKYSKSKKHLRLYKIFKKCRFLFLLSSYLRFAEAVSFDIKKSYVGAVQTDLRNIGALQKSGKFTKYWRPAEKQADNRILAGVKIPSPGEKLAGLENTGGTLTV
jgi:hypothetical protein